MSQYPSVKDLEAAWFASPREAREEGEIALIVTRASAAEMPAGQNKLTTPIHHTPRRVRFSVQDGIDGDRWKAGKTRSSQISLTSLRVAQIVAGDAARFHLFGNNFVIDLDLSIESLPVGTRLSLGSGEIEISDEPHTPCDRYEARFGSSAFQWVEGSELTERCLRGRYAMVVREGEVSLDDPIRVISR